MMPRVQQSHRLPNLSFRFFVLVEFKEDRGEIRSGNSGGPAVDGRGRVVPTVFAASRSGPKGGFGVPPGIVASVLDGAGAPADTGPCVR